MSIERGQLTVLSKPDSFPPGIFYGWWIVAACTLLSLFIGGLVTYCFTAFIEPIARELHWSYAQISFAVSLRVAELGLMSPIVGWLIDKWGIRKVVLLGSSVLCFGLFLFSRMDSLLTFYASFIFIGIGTTCGAQAAIQTIVAKWFHRRAGLAIGIATSGYGLSGLLLPVVTSIIALYGWRSAALAMMFSILVVVIPVVFVLRNEPGRRVLTSSEDNTVEKISPEAPGDKKTNTDSSWSLKQALHAGNFWMLSFTYAIMYFIVQAVVTHIMPFLSSITLDRQLSSIIAAGMPVASVAGRIGFGFLSDKFDKRLTASLSFLVMCLTLLCFAFASHFGALFILAASFLFGIGYGGAITLSGALISEQFGNRNFGSIYGALTGVSFLGNLSGAPAAGLVYDYWHNYQLFWLFAAILAIAAILLIQNIRSKTNTSMKASI